MIIMIIIVVMIIIMIIIVVMIIIMIIILVMIIIVVMIIKPCQETTLPSHQGTHHLGEKVFFLADGDDFNDDIILKESRG